LFSFVSEPWHLENRNILSLNTLILIVLPLLRFPEVPFQLHALPGIALITQKDEEAIMTTS
jgi:hypothetical protein